MVIDVEELKRLRKARHYSYSDLASESGVPLATVQKIFGGITKSPRKDTLEALSRVLGEGNKTYLDPDNQNNASEVDEEAHLYLAQHDITGDSVHRLLMGKKQGEFTVDDYYHISEKWRIELIDGVIYDLASPSYNHQHIAGLIYAQMLAHRFDNNMLDCTPSLAPLDVQLCKDNKTMVQPDLIVLCEQKKNMGSKVYGAPDFVLEVLSQSTRMKDIVTKRDKYRSSGVREYWIVDPVDMRVTVYDFESKLDGIYTFDQKIPVRISGERCVIDFALIKADLRRLAEQRARELKA